MRQKSTIPHKCADPAFIESGGVDSGIGFWTGKFLWDRVREHVGQVNF